MESISLPWGALGIGKRGRGWWSGGGVEGRRGRGWWRRGGVEEGVVEEGWNGGRQVHGE